MRTAKPTTEELVNQLRNSVEIIKSLNEKIDRQQIRLDAIDLMSCFMFSKVPEVPEVPNAYWKNDRNFSLVSQYERYMKEKEYDKHRKEINKQLKTKKVK